MEKYDKSKRHVFYPVSNERPSSEPLNERRRLNSEPASVKFNGSCVSLTTKVDDTLDEIHPFVLTPKRLKKAQTGEKKDKDKQKVQQTKGTLRSAVLEFLNTEKEHLNSLKKLGEVFPGFMNDLACVHGIELTESETRTILMVEKHILGILPTHKAINDRFLTAIKNLNEDPSNPKIADILKEFTPMLKMCSYFLKDKTDITNNLLACQEQDFEFKLMCREFQRIAFLGRPLTNQLDCVHQRVMEYAFLLHNYIKYLAPDSEEYGKTQEAIQKIIAVANDLDKQLVTNFFSFEEMMKLGNRLQGEFNMFQPGRKLRKHGNLKKQGRKNITDVYLILFSDRLLYCRPLKNDALDIGLELIIDNRCKVITEEHEDFQKQFIFQSTNRSLIFVARDKVERDEWVQAIRTVTDQDQKAMHALHRRDTFERGVCVPRRKTSENCGWWAPPFRPNDSVTMCQIAECNAKFTTIKRRHHCRCCGNVICSDCSGWAPMYYTDFHADRVCGDCYCRILNKLKEGYFDGELNNTGIRSRGDLKSRFKPPKNNWSVRRKSLTHSTRRDEEGSVTGYLQRWDEKRNEWTKLWAKLPFGSCELQLYLGRNDNMYSEKMLLYGNELRVFQLEDSMTEMELIHRNLCGPMEKLHTFRINTAESAEKWATAFRQACSGKREINASMIDLPFKFFMEQC